jgi:hypothetical protein
MKNYLKSEAFLAVDIYTALTGIRSTKLVLSSNAEP